MEVLLFLCYINDIKSMIFKGYLNLDAFITVSEFLKNTPTSQLVTLKNKRFTLYHGNKNVNKNKTLNSNDLEVYPVGNGILDLCQYDEGFLVSDQ